MDLTCTLCENEVSIKDFLGTVHMPYCTDCWNEHWKGREEELVFEILSTLKSK